MSLPVPEVALPDRITIRPDVHFREDIPADIIRRDYYPDLTGDDIRACVQYAIDLIALDDLRPVPARRFWPTRTCTPPPSGSPAAWDTTS